MNITVDTGAATIITAILVGLISAVTTIIANRHSLKQLKMQWERENEKAERAERQAEKNRELERQKALIDRLQEIYGKAIESITPVPIHYQDDGEPPLRSSEYAADLAEAQKWLALVLVYHPDQQSKEYQSFFKSYRDTFNDKPPKNIWWLLQRKILEVASSDPRLQGKAVDSEITANKLPAGGK